MEPQKRLAVINELLEETTHKIEALAKTLIAQGAVGTQNALQEERTWWETAHQHLAEARAALEQAAIYERSRGGS